MLRQAWQLLKAGRHWERLKFAWSVCLQDPTLYPLNVHPAFDDDLCARMFIRNHMLLHAQAQANGSQALTYLQPWNGYGARPRSRHDAANVVHLQRRVSVDGVTELDAAHSFYRRVTADFQRRTGNEFIDMTTVLDHVRSHVYVDHVHCSDLGYDLMARRIADDILAREAAAP